MKKIREFLHKYRHAWLLSYAFIYLPWFMYLERTVTRDYHIMHASLDDLIPFNEYFIIPYLLWFLYVAGTLVFFLFRSKEDYYKMCTFLFSGMTLSLIICTFFHNGTDFRPVIDPNKNIFSAAVAALYKTDTCTNVFPSIHVYNAVGTHIAISRSQILAKYRFLRLGSLLLTISICLATMFFKTTLHHRCMRCFPDVLCYPLLSIRIRNRHRRQEDNRKSAWLKHQAPFYFIFLR